MGGVRKHVKSLIVFSVLFLAPGVAVAASFLIAPGSGEREVGTEFDIEIVVSTDESINAVSGEMSFPGELLEVLSVSDSGSIVDYWVEEPVYSNVSGTLSFSGVATGGSYQGAGGSVMTVTFAALGAGAGELLWEEGTVLAHDGVGTDVIESLVGAQFTLVQPELEPELELPPEENEEPDDAGPSDGSDSDTSSEDDGEPSLTEGESTDEEGDEGAATEDRSPVTEVFSGSVERVGEAVQAVVEIADKALESPAGKTVTKTVSTVGIAGGGASLFATLAFNFGSFGNMLLIPLRLWGLLLALLGLKKRHRPWGTVYDSVTKQPLDPAYVMLKDANGKEVNASLTDLDGRYGFLLSPGDYTIEAKKTNYSFPSDKLSGSNQDELYKSLYFGEPIRVSEEDGVVLRNIPLDPQGFDWNEFAKRDQHLMKFYSRFDVLLQKVTRYFFILGFGASLVALVFTPAPYNVIIFVLYVGLLVLRATGPGARPYGVVTESETGNPLSYAVVRVFMASVDQEVKQSVCDRFGRYYCLVAPGRYYVTVERKNEDESYTLVYTSPHFSAARGLISEHIKA